MGNKDQSRRTMEETSTNEEVEATNEKNTTFYLYHPCSLLQKFLGTLFKCLGFEIETNKKEHDEVKSPSDTEEDVRTDDNTTSEHESSQKVLACAEQKECSSSTTSSFQFIRTLIIRRGGPRRSGSSSGSGPGIN
ncbi:uncharacterized protein LOC123907753 [Trifolium pratense]|uniref:uncharacterized protein LOC123907753 n=1 Tax=Trifolium pratense TaxID=57577 RepID=UPI001E695832|nr:uncharacterized protein LOC123907753 [Trifolium pratense]